MPVSSELPTQTPNLNPELFLPVVASTEYAPVPPATKLDGSRLAGYTSGLAEVLANQSPDFGEPGSRQAQIAEISAATRIKNQVARQLAENPRMTHAEVAAWLDASLSNLGSKTPADHLGGNATTGEQAALRTALEQLRLMSQIDESYDYEMAIVVNTMIAQREAVEEANVRDSALAGARHAVDRATTNTGPAPKAETRPSPRPSRPEASAEAKQEGMTDAEIEAYLQEVIAKQLPGGPGLPTAEQGWAQERVEPVADIVQRLLKHSLTVEQRERLDTEYKRLQAILGANARAGQAYDPTARRGSGAIRSLLAESSISVEDPAKAKQIFRTLGYPPDQLRKLEASVDNAFTESAQSRIGKTFFRNPDGSFDYGDTMMTVVQPIKESRRR